VKETWFDGYKPAGVLLGEFVDDVKEAFLRLSAFSFQYFQKQAISDMLERIVSQERYFPPLAGPSSL
jgi:hypothetical protein